MRPLCSTSRCASAEVEAARPLRILGTGNMGSVWIGLRTLSCPHPRATPSNATTLRGPGLCTPLLSLSRLVVGGGERARRRPRRVGANGQRGGGQLQHLAAAGRGRAAERVGAERRPESLGGFRAARAVERLLE